MTTDPTSLLRIVPLLLSFYARVSPFGPYAVISLCSARAQSESLTGLISDVVGAQVMQRFYVAHLMDVLLLLSPIISRPVKNALANRKRQFASVSPYGTAAETALLLTAALETPPSHDTESIRLSCATSYSMFGQLILDDVETSHWPLACITAFKAI